jgi:hypothetical protein
MRGGLHRAVVLARGVEDNMPTLVNSTASDPIPGPILGPVPGLILGPILGIESSCDETAAAVLDADGRVLAEAVLSQQHEHAPFGGVVPEIAARSHLAHLPALVRDVAARAGVELGALAAIAATAGPGLIGGLIVGSQFAKGIAIAHRLPYIAVNHLEAHALTARLPGLTSGPDNVSFLPQERVGRLLRPLAVPRRSAGAFMRHCMVGEGRISSLFGSS